MCGEAVTTAGRTGRIHIRAGRRQGGHSRLCRKLWEYDICHRSLCCRFRSSQSRTNNARRATTTTTTHCEAIQHQHRQDHPRDIPQLRRRSCRLGHFLHRWRCRHRIQGPSGLHRPSRLQDRIPPPNREQSGHDNGGDQSDMHRRWESMYLRLSRGDPFRYHIARNASPR